MLFEFNFLPPAEALFAGPHRSNGFYLNNPAPGEADPSVLSPAGIVLSFLEIVHGQSEGLQSWALRLFFLRSLR